MPIKLKDGSTTHDPRLDRLVHFDQRSRNFPIRALLEDKPERSYTWSCPAWYDQGREGACVAYAMGHELAAMPAKVMGIDDSWLRQVYHEAQMDDPWPGGSYPGASPQYEGTAVLAGVKVVQKQRYFLSYRWAFGLHDLILGVGYNGPAVIGVNWYDGMYTIDAEGYIRRTGEWVGGHAILVRGVNVRTRRFLLRNSWGRDWGMQGDCYVSFEDMEALLHEDGEAVFMLNRKATP